MKTERAWKKEKTARGEQIWRQYIIFSRSILYPSPQHHTFISSDLHTPRYGFRDALDARWAWPISCGLSLSFFFFLLRELPRLKESGGNAMMEGQVAFGWGSGTGDGAEGIDFKLWSVEAKFGNWVRKDENGGLGVSVACCGFVSEVLKKIWSEGR